MAWESSLAAPRIRDSIRFAIATMTASCSRTKSPSSALTSISTRTALDEPVGGGKPLGAYVMDLAESDPDALSSSLVLQRDEELRLDRRGRPLVDNEGIELPPLWRPTKIHASDIVAVGDAVDGFLSADSLPDAVVRTSFGNARAAVLWAIRRIYPGTLRGVARPAPGQPPRR